MKHEHGKIFNRNRNRTHHHRIALAFYRQIAGGHPIQNRKCDFLFPDRHVHRHQYRSYTYIFHHFEIQIEGVSYET